MDTTGFADLSRAVIEALESVSSSTETVYGAMGESYPVMVRELSARFGQNLSGASGGDHGALVQAIRELSTVSRGYEDRFSAAQEESLRRLEQWQAQMGTLKSLGSNVDEVREDSVLMELLSLNAMVIAAKAGEAGRAFGCITTELKQLSNQTQGLTDDVSRREDVLDRAFDEFKAEWEGTEGGEKQEITRFLQSLRTILTTLEAGASKLVAGLDHIHAKADEVKPPLVKIMVEIQNQDRIRQSIDHVLLSLREFRGHDGTASLDVRLDDLCYLEILPALSTMVLDEILDQIRGNRAVFHQALVQAGEQIGRLEQERSAFLDEQFDRRSEDNLEEIFGRGQRLFAEFISATGTIFRDRERLVRKGGLILKRVTELVETLRTFEPLISRFRNIDLASRIQVARQSQLVSMRDNASSMTELTRKIEADVGGAIGSASDFAGAVQSLFGEYQDQFTARYREDESFIRQVTDLVAVLHGIRERLVRSIQANTMFTATFTEKFALTQADLQTLDRLMETIDRQKASLETIKARIADEKRRLMAERGVTEWKLDKDKLKAMVEGFTIFTHKQFAAELGDFKVEQAVESGDVTLF